MIDRSVDAIRQRIAAARKTGDPAKARLWLGVLRKTSFERLRGLAVQSAQGPAGMDAAPRERRSTWT
jgi:hypothetical protein